MNRGGLGRLVRSLGGTATGRAGGDAADAALLDRFCRRGDGDAFAALVQRHGPLVLGVCRRALHNQADAEDALQATFLILARKAGSLRRPGLLANWLYGVAYRTARKMRVAAARRRAKERQAAVGPGVDPPADVVWADLRPVLDDEVSRLPERYRLPFLLCYVEGRTNEEAARLLGCPKGTVLSRLAWARQRLRFRLSRRGVTPSAGLLAASPAVPPALASATARAATAFGAGGAAAAGVPAAVTTLAEGVLRAMSASRSKAVAAFVGAVAFLVALAGAITGYALADKPPAAKPPAVPRAASAVAFRQAAVSAEDLVEMTGLNVYKFQLEVPRGQRFRVALSRWAAEGSPAKVVWHYDFEREAGGPLVLRVAFLRRDGKLQGVLLDGEAEAGFRLDCEGCRPGGLATIVKNPLADVPPTERMLLVLPSEKAWGHSKAGPTRLLAVARTKPGVSLGDLEGAYPRAELTVERLPNAD